MNTFFLNIKFFKMTFKLTDPILFLAMIFSLGPQTAYADCGFDYRSPAFDYYPSISPTSGDAPLGVEAKWNQNWSNAYDENPDTWTPPIHELFLYLDWGDGAIVNIPEERCPDSSITPGYGTKNWAAQTLVHTYNNPGIYTVRLGFQSGGSMNWSNRATITVLDPEPSMDDSDGDGVSDELDNCPNESGPLWNNGCPEPPKDSDNDGVNDDQDKCPTEFGQVSNYGCPLPPADADGDGIPDNQDDCPDEFGTASNNGCQEEPLDTDGDGIPNDLDSCPDDIGPASNNGCPENNVKRFEIKYMAFIPANYIDTPLTPEAKCILNVAAPTLFKLPLIYAGDDRGFNPFASENGQYRVMQKITVVKEESSDGRSNFYVESGSMQTRINASHSYVRNGIPFLGGGALTHGDIGRIDPSDDDGKTLDCVLLHEIGSESGDRVKPIKVTVLNKDKIRVNFKGKARNGLISIGPSIDWSFKVIIDTSKEIPVVIVRGKHDKFPAHEIYVNNQTTYQYAPLELSPAQLPIVRVDPIDVLVGLITQRKFRNRVRLK